MHNDKGHNQDKPNVPAGKPQKPGRKRASVLVRIVKALLLTVMGVVLFVFGVLVTLVSVLTPERLTPIVEHVATSQLQYAHVSMDHVELSLRQTMPFLNIDVRGLRVISTAIDSLAPGVRAPQWADTVLTVDRFTGGINPFVIVAGKISLNDVTICRPTFNYVAANDSVTNLSIFAPSAEPKEEKPFDRKSLPQINIKRFAIVGDMPVRYLDLAGGMSIDANFRKIALDGNGKPIYTLSMAGNVHTPLLDKYLTLPHIELGMDGNLTWDQADPLRLKINDMSLAFDMFRGNLSLELDAAGGGLQLDSMEMAMEPVSVSRALELLPAALKADYGIPSGIVTDATVALKGRLTKPFSLTESALPHGVLNIDIPDSQFHWQRVHLSKMAANIDIIVPGDKIGDIVVKINRMNLQGPATALVLQGTVKSLTDDPELDGTVRGTCNLSNLPPILLRYIPGNIRGRLKADALIKMRPSYLSINRYHKLHILGDISLSDFSFAGNDSTTTAYIDKATFHFGTNTRRENNGQKYNALLAARITVDSASLADSVMDVRLTNLDFRLGAANKTAAVARGDKRPAIVPMGGRLDIGTIRFAQLTDSAIVRARGISGNAFITGHNDDAHTPELRFDLNIKRFIAGDRTTRIILRDAGTAFAAWPEPQSRRAKAIRQLADSIARCHRKLPSDSIFARAIAQYESRRTRRPGHRQRIADTTEVIDFAQYKMLGGVLDNWHLQGELSAARAGLYTPYFPLRNRLSNVNISFNNDSIIMHDVRYKAGHSDFTMSGSVRNLRRVFTSRTGRQPLYINLAINSDTIDINQLAETAFAGSAYRHGAGSVNTGIDLDAEDESKLEAVLDKQLAVTTDTMRPLLIPQNIEAQLDITARNVMYSDLHLHDMRGKVLTYQGALNMSELSARSDIGSINLSALYIGRQPDSLQFGFGMQVDRFNIHRFLQLVPAIDSIMPLLRDFGGIISADIAATTDLTPTMDFRLNTLRSAIKLSGDSLVLLDPDTFKSLSKWLMFKDKKRNIIDRMSVQLLIENNMMQLFPFMFNIDRYKLGVQGHNDLAMNFNYHIAVLKSPIPFKFGINIKGNPDDFKIRLGGAKFNEKMSVDVTLVDTTRVNLVRSIESIFRRGVRGSRMRGLDMSRLHQTQGIDLSADSLSHADSVMFIRQGLIAAPDTVPLDPKAAKKAEKELKKAEKRQLKAEKKHKKQALAAPALTTVTMLAVGRRKRKDKSYDYQG